MGFVGSKAFLVAVVLAVVILAAGVGAYALGRSALGFESRHGCEMPSIAGPLVAPQERENATFNGHPARFETWVLQGFANASTPRVAACSISGDVTVRPSRDGMARVTVLVTARSQEALDDTRVKVGYAPGDAARLAVWVDRFAETRTFFGTYGSDVEITLELPTSAPVDVRALTTSGDVEVRELLVRDVDLESTSGDMLLDRVDLAGNLTAQVTSGDMDFHISSVVGGNVTLSGTSGDISLRLPERADVGYDARVDVTSGDISLDLGPKEIDESSRGHAHARTQGYAAKPAHEDIRIEVTSGDIDIRVG